MGSCACSSGFSAAGKGVLGTWVCSSGFSGVVGVTFCFSLSPLGVGVSCFLGVDLLMGGVGVLGGVFGMVLFSGFKGMEDSCIHLVGSILDFNHDGDSLKFGSVTVRHFAGILGTSGFRVLPFGELTPSVGGVVVLSRLGWVYGPNVVRSTFLYSMSPMSFIHSSKLS